MNQRFLSRAAVAAVVSSIAALAVAGNAGSEEEILARIAPVAKFELQPGAAGGAGGAKDPASIYASTCVACHGAGVAGAPKKGDKAAWAPRLASGLDAMVKSAIAGKGAMPPKGGAASLTDDEFKAVVEYITK